MSIRISYETKNFYKGIQDIRRICPYLSELFKDIPELPDTQCEDYAIISLIETIAVTPPLTIEKLAFKQRINLLGTDEVIYTLPNEDIFGWQRNQDSTWLFWYIKDTTEVAA